MGLERIGVLTEVRLGSMQNATRGGQVSCPIEASDLCDGLVRTPTTLCPYALLQSLV